MPGAGTVEVWSGPLRPTADADEAVLSAAERDRLAGWRRPADRWRSVLGAALLRHAVAATTGTGAAAVVVARRCPTCGGPHGRPELPGTGLQASLTHAGGWVGVALATAPVGLDVEPVVDLDVGALAPTLLHPGARAGVRTPTDLLQRWVRTEALLKATGEGLTVDPAAVDLEHGPTGARRAGPPATAGPAVTVVDVTPGPGHVGAVARAGPAPVRVVQGDASAVPAGWGSLSR